MKQWHGLLFDKNLVYMRLPPAESVTTLARSAGGFSQIEVRRGQDGKVALLEENVETLLMAGFQEVFGGGLKLLVRQRALFQAPDIIGIDRIGRLAIIELKTKMPNPANILAQTSEYLVQTASRTPCEIIRAVKEYAQRQPVYHLLYHAGLIYRKAAEHRPGLGRLLKDRGLLNQQLTQGPEYFSAMADACERTLANQGVDFEASYSRVALPEFTTPMTYSSLLSDLFDYDLHRSEGALQASANRSWKIVYFCPRYWFDTDTEVRSTSELTDMVAGMFARGLEIEFIEYRLVCGTAEGAPPWLLAWRTADEWLHRNTKAKRRKEEAAILDALTEKLLRRGIMARKEPGSYYWWWLVVPWIGEVQIEWDPWKPEIVTVGFPDSLRYHFSNAISQIKPGLKPIEKSDSSRLQLRVEAGNLDGVAEAFEWVAESFDKPRMSRPAT